MNPFSKAEYQARIDKTRQSMAGQGMDLLILSQPANMNYLTGYDGWSFYVHQCLIVSLEQDQPIWIGRGMDANQARLLTFLDEENICAYADDFVQSTEKHAMHYVADIIRERGWAARRIGIEMDQFYFTHRSAVELQNSLPDATFLDANALVNWVRIIKSDAEIEYMKIAGQIASRVVKTAIDAIDVGVRECDAAAQIAHAQYSGTDTHAGDYPAIVPLMMAGEKTKTPHLTWSERPFKRDEAVLLELSGVYRHYHCPIAATIFLGETPPQIMKDTSEVVLEGLREALNIVKPGVLAEEVEAKWRETIARAGIVKESRIGYSIGLNYPPDWGEQSISIRPGDKTPLQQNMAIHLIPGIWFDEVGFEVDASIRVTETGYESLFDFEQKLYLKP